MFGNLISIPQVSGVYPDLGVNQESLKRLGIPYGVRIPQGPEEDLKAQWWGWGAARRSCHHRLSICRWWKNQAMGMWKEDPFCEITLKKIKPKRLMLPFSFFPSNADIITIQSLLIEHVLGANVFFISSYAVHWHVWLFNKGSLSIRDTSERNVTCFWEPGCSDLFLVGGHKWVCIHPWVHL